MGNAKLHRILRFRMGSHALLIEEGRHSNQPRASRVCNLCNPGALGDERHMLLECPALTGLRLQFSSLLLSCSSIMRRLLWAKDQHEISRYIIACLGGTYVPPPSSAILHPSSAEDRFSGLAEAAAAASALGKIVLMGDFNARVAARPDIDASTHGDLLDCQLPVVRGCTDMHFGGHAKQLLQLCLSADLTLGTGCLPGNIHAPLSYPHAAGGLRPDHLALDLGIAADIQTSTVDSSRLESDHFPLCVTLQCSLAPQPGAVSGADGTPLPRLSWDDSHREAYVQALDGLALDACTMLAAQGSIPRACEQLSAAVLAAAQASGCRFKPAVSAGPPCSPPTQRRREHKPFFDRECQDLKRLYQHTRSRDPEQAHVLLRKYASVVRRKCRIYRQLQTDTLLRSIRSRPRDFWRKLNSTASGSSTWPTCVLLPHRCPPCPSASTPPGAQQLAAGLNDAITSGEVQAALPLLNSGKSCAKSLDGLQSCCGMPTKRSQWRMARSASCMCWRPSWLPYSTVHSRVAHSQLQSSLPSSRRSSKREMSLTPVIIAP